MSGRDLVERLAAILVLERCDPTDENDCLVTLIAAEDRPCSPRMIALVLDEVRDLAREMLARAPSPSQSQRKH